MEVVIGGKHFLPAGVGKLGEWICVEEDEEGDVVTEARRVVFAYPENINRVEVRFVREASDIGSVFKNRASPSCRLRNRLPAAPDTSVANRPR